MWEELHEFRIGKPSERLQQGKLKLVRGREAAALSSECRSIGKPGKWIDYTLTTECYENLLHVNNPRVQCRLCKPNIGLKPRGISIYSKT